MNTKDIVQEAYSYKPYDCSPIRSKLFRFIRDGWAIRFEDSEIMRVDFRSDAEKITCLLNAAYAQGRLQELKQEMIT